MILTYVCTQNTCVRISIRQYVYDCYWKLASFFRRTSIFQKVIRRCKKNRRFLYTCKRKKRERLLENKLLLSKRQNDYHQDEQPRKWRQKKNVSVIYGKWMRMSRQPSKFRLLTHDAKALTKRNDDRAKKRANSCGWIPAVLSSMFVTDKRTIYSHFHRPNVRHTFRDLWAPRMFEAGKERKNLHTLVWLVYVRNKQITIYQAEMSEWKSYFYIYHSQDQRINTISAHATSW